MAKQTNVLLLPGMRIHICPKVGSTAIQNCLAPLKYQHRSPDEPGTEYRFMVVRHPLDRIVSAWAFFCKDDPTRIDYVLKDIGYQLGMTFDAFLEICLKRHHENRHTRKQVYFAGPHKIDHLCPLERLSEDWALLRERFPNLNSIEHNHISEHDHWSSYYDSSQRKAAEAVFAEDINLFQKTGEL